MSEFESPESSDPVHDRRDAADELLDRLLEEARWPEPGADSLQRLEARWDAMITETVVTETGATPLRSNTGWKWWSAAAAALLAVSGLAWWGLGWRTGERIADGPAIEIETSDGEQKIEIPAKETPSAPRAIREATAEVPDDPEPSWRQPNAYERVLVIAHRRSRNVEADRSSDDSNAEPPTRARTESKREVIARLKERVSDTIETIRAAPEESSDTLLADLDAKEQRQVEALLGKHVAASTVDEQIAALKLLVPLASSRSLPVLRAAAVNEKLRDLVLPALLRLEDSPRLVQFALDDSGRERRRIIFASLWDRQDPATWNLVFQCASDSPVHTDAAAALVNAEQPPIDWLCGVITDSPRVAERTTAAELLARLESPEVTSRLIELTDDAASRQAALLGLLASSEPSARKFLVSAEQNPFLVASIFNARSQQAKP